MDVNKKTVCLVRSSEFDPDPRAERLARYLSRNLAKVILIGLNRSTNRPNREMRDNITVERLVFGRAGRLPVGQLLIAPFIMVWAQWVFTRLVRNRPDIVIASDFDALIPSLLYCLLTRKPLVYDPHDFYADNFQKPVPNWLATIVRRLERDAVVLADAMILPDISRLEQYDCAKVPPRIAEIVNCPESVPSVTDECYERSDDNQPLIVLYAGLLYRNRGILDLIHSVNGQPWVRIIVAGYGSIQEDVVRALEMSGNGTFLGRLNHEQIMRLTQSSDVVFAMYDPRIPNNRFASPNKLFEAMACGKPVVVNTGTRLSDLVRFHQCGIAVDYGDKHAIMEALHRLHDTKTRRELGHNGLIAYRCQYSWDIMELRLKQIFDEL